MPDDLMPLAVALMAAVALSAVVFTFIYPFIASDRQKDKRVQNVSESRAKKVASRSAAEVAASRRKAVSDTLKDIDNRKKTKERLTMRLRLERAGLEMTTKTFWIASAALGVVAGVAIVIFAPPSPYLIPLAIAGAFVAGLGVPRWVIGFLIKRRQAKFTLGLANAMDVVVRGIKSGLPLNECLGIIARESPEPLASEFKEVVEQQRVGVTLAEALDRLVARMPLPEVKFLAIVITIQQQSGGNLSEALGNLAGVLRDRFGLAMKVKALSAEAKASAMVLGSLPPGVVTMLYISSPDYIRPLYETKSGTFFVLTGIVWMVVGILIMRKMINFKY